MGRIISLDPGLANTGVVYYDGKRIVHSETWKTVSGGSHRVDFTGAIERCRIQSQALSIAMCDYVPDVIVMESYRDFGGTHKREVANRWTTPLLIGYLASVIDDFASVRKLVFQDPQEVMSGSRAIRERWKSHQGGIIEGEELLTNEHLRSAGAHLLVYLNRQRFPDGD